MTLISRKLEVLVSVQRYGSGCVYLGLMVFCFSDMDVDSTARREFSAGTDMPEERGWKGGFSPGSKFPRGTK